MGKLGIEQSHHMTPRSEGASFLFYPSFARQFGNQMGRNEVAKLVDNSESANGWLVPFVFFSHLALWQGSNH